MTTDAELDEEIVAVKAKRPDEVMNRLTGLTASGSAFNPIDDFITDHYLRKLFLWIIVWVTVLIGFVWIVDPYGVSPLRVNLPGINLKKPKRLDIDRLIKPYEVWRYQPKTVFLGTSRIQQSIDPAVFEGSEFAPAYNAAIPASTLDENGDHIEQYLMLNPHIKHIFIELFFYNFTTPQVQKPPKSWREFLSNSASLLVSSDALTDAIHTVVDNRQHGPVSSYIDKGGYRVPSSDFNPAHTFSEVLNIRTVIAADRIGKMSLQPTAINSLDRIVAIAYHHGVQLHLLVTPNYPWDDYRLMSLGYWPLLEEWLRKIATYPNVVSFSQYNELIEETPTLSPHMKWWNDPIHFSLAMGHAMMRAYLGYQDPGMPTNFMLPVSAATVEGVINQRRAGALHWAEKHPDFAADFEELKIIPDSLSGSLDISAKKLLVDGKLHPIVLGAGEVEFTTRQEYTLVAYGWAIDEIEKRHVSQLIVTMGSSIVARGFATAARSDIKLALDEKVEKSGFSIDISLKNWHGTEPIRVFALMKDGRAVQLRSKTRVVAGASLGELRANTLVIDGKNYPIINDRLAGALEGFTLIDGGYNVYGWVADIKANGPAKAIVAAVDSNIVAQELPTINREDIIAGIASGAKPSGFNMNVPLDVNQITPQSQVQVFALMADGVAAPLASHLEVATHGLFKDRQLP